MRDEKVLDRRVDHRRKIERPLLGGIEELVLCPFSLLRSRSGKPVGTQLATQRREIPIAGRDVDCLNSARLNLIAKAFLE